MILAAKRAGGAEAEQVPGGQEEQAMPSAASSGVDVGRLVASRVRVCRSINYMQLTMRLHVLYNDIAL